MGASLTGPGVPGLTRIQCGDQVLRSQASFESGWEQRGGSGRWRPDGRLPEISPDAPTPLRRSLRHHTAVAPKQWQPWASAVGLPAQGAECYATWTGSWRKKQMALRDLGGWEVYLTPVGSEKAALPRSEPRAQAGREISALLLLHTWCLWPTWGKWGGKEEPGRALRPEFPCWLVSRLREPLFPLDQL